MEIQTIIFQSPVGLIKISAVQKAIKSVCFIDSTVEDQIHSNISFPILEECKKQLCEYFTGERKHFSLLVEPEGTAFQQKVWNALLDVSYGKTATYGELACKLGDRNLMRAVGGANGKNPVAIIIPCHRVIGTSGTLTGYAGGLWRKKWLLDLEQPEKQTLLF